MKKKRARREPIKPFKLISAKHRDLISLLTELRDETSKQGHTNKDALVLNCCEILITILEEQI